MAQKKDSADVVRNERAKDAPDGTPLSTTTPKYADPGPGVSNADIDLQKVSADAAHSSYHENPDPNPNDLRPAPGPSTIQVLGVPKGGDDDPSNPFEETR